jgi:hypothetical protein
MASYVHIGRHVEFLEFEMTASPDTRGDRWSAPKIATSAHARMEHSRCRGLPRRLLLIDQLYFPP